MNSSYRATYINSAGRQFPATIFLSKVTLSIRYKDELNQDKDIHWLAERIQSMETSAFDTRLVYPMQDGKLELLVIREEALKDAVKKNFRSYKFAGASVRHRMFSSARSKVLLLLGIIFAALAIVYLWVLPWVGEKVAMRFSKAYEIELGESMYQSTIAGYKIDAEKTKIINQFYQSLHYSTGYPISITVVESNDMNAFAIPGGHIVVYDAILKGMKTPEELAALLGHEASHVVKRHSLRSLFRSLARRMFILLLVGNDSGIISFLANNADALKGLEYSRALETEADDNGMRMMNENKIDPAGMLRLMELLQSETKTKEGEPYSFLSTHPVFKDRISNIREQVAKYASTEKAPEDVRKNFEDLKAQW